MKADKVDNQGRSEAEYLAQYKPRDYKRPSVSVDMCIIAQTPELRVLLVKRGNHPFIEDWAIPGGFVNVDEDIDTAAYRELKEETGVEAISLTQIHTYGAIDRDPRMRVISVAYLALIDQCIPIIAGDDAKDARWFTIYTRSNLIELIDEKKEYTICYTCDDKPVLKSAAALAFDHIHILLDALNAMK